MHYTVKVIAKDGSVADEVGKYATGNNAALNYESIARTLRSGESVELWEHNEGNSVMLCRRHHDQLALGL